VGRLTAEILGIRDAGGDFAGGGVSKNEGWNQGATAFSYDASSSRGYVEVHIEQGRVARRKLGEPVLRGLRDLRAEAGCSLRSSARPITRGTTPMDLRRDALAGAAECILAAESAGPGKSRAGRHRRPSST